jgi:hypothetical protein
MLITYGSRHSHIFMGIVQKSANLFSEFTVFNMQRTVYSEQCAANSVQGTVCSEQFTVFNVKCYAYSVQYCRIQCAV